jgi:hypothetical protein
MSSSTRDSEERRNSEHCANFPAVLNQAGNPRVDASRNKIGTTRGFTLVEALVISFSILIVLFSLPLAVSWQRKVARVRQCQENLKMIGLACRTWSSGSSDQFAFGVEAKYGGSLEATTNGDVFQNFQVLSNGLGTPSILVCPTDNRSAARDFGP